MVSTAMKRILRAAACAALLLPLAAVANEGMKLQPAPIRTQDLESLQNGARLFVNYCLNCHSANYMRYNRLRELGLSEELIRDNLIFTGVKVGDLMQVAMDKKDAKQWFGAPPPDLTVIARSRSSSAGSGTDWVYNYLRAFYRDDSRPTGWNNLVFENVAMPHVLWQLSGQHRLEKQEFEKHDEAVAALIATKTIARLEEVPATDGKPGVRFILRSVVPAPGSPSQTAYDRAVTDLVNYLDFMAEPARHERRRMGIYALMLLGLFFVFAYGLKKRFWKDVH